VPQFLARCIIGLAGRVSNVSAKPGDHLCDRSHRSCASRPPTGEAAHPLGSTIRTSMRLRAAPWPSPARSRRLPPSPPCRPVLAQPGDQLAPPLCGLGNVCRCDSERMHASTLSLATSIRRQRDCLVPSSTPFLARFGLEALATVRVEEEHRSCPSLSDRLIAFGRVRDSDPATGGW
jgi:hypothetical protein